MKTLNFFFNLLINGLRCGLFLILFCHVTILAQTRIIVNPDLEFGVPAGTMMKLDTNFGFQSTFDSGSDRTKPWYTTEEIQSGVCSTGFFGDCHPMTVSGNGYGGVLAAQGTNYIEMSSGTSTMIYQNMYIMNGDVLNYYFRHRVKGDINEQISLVIEDQNNINLATIHTTLLPSSLTTWSVNQGNYTFNGITGVYRVGFRTLNTGNQGNQNLLDDIRVSLKPIIDFKFSNALASCEGSSNGYLFLRISGEVVGVTTVALEMIDPANGSAFANDEDIVLSGVSNANGTPYIAHTPGTSIYLITIPPGNYDGGITPGYLYPNNDMDGVAINISSLNDLIDEPNEAFKFEIKKHGTNGSTDNFICDSPPVFEDDYYPTTNDYLIQRCICYDDANKSGAGVDSKFGITLLPRVAGIESGWPMIRKSAHAVLESNTKGFVITRLTTLQVNSMESPQEGMMVYDTIAKCLKIYDGTAWYCYNTATCP